MFFLIPLRASQGFVNSVFRLAQVSLSSRSTVVSVAEPKVDVRKDQFNTLLSMLQVSRFMVRASGKLKNLAPLANVKCGAKLHIAVDTDTHEITTHELVKSTQWSKR